MEQPDLIPRPPGRYLSDDELTEALATVMAPGIRCCREADLYLATVCARHLASRLLSSGLKLVECPK